MSMVDWADNEIQIAIKNELSDNIDNISKEYIIGCYESALKAYKCLMNDGHSGTSFSIIKSILNKLIDGQPLTPLEDTKDDWNLISEREEYSLYQHKRRSSLFKETHPNGPVYHDIDRVICYDINNPKSTYSNGFISEKIHEMYPIYFPYVPSTTPYRVCRETFLFDKVNGGDFDTMGIFYMITPIGERVEINKCYKKYRGEYWKEIDYQEYYDRLHSSDSE